MGQKQNINKINIKKVRYGKYRNKTKKIAHKMKLKN